VNALEAVLERRRQAVEDFARIVEDFERSGRADLTRIESGALDAARRTVNLCDQQIRAARNGQPVRFIP
jgi:hypothetical protein